MVVYSRKGKEERFYTALGSFTILIILGMITLHFYNGKQETLNDNQEIKSQQQNLTCDRSAQNDARLQNCPFQDDLKIRTRHHKHQQMDFIHSTANDDFIVLVISRDGEDISLTRSINFLLQNMPEVPIIISIPNMNENMKNKFTDNSWVKFVQPPSHFFIPFASYAQKAFATLTQLAQGKLWSLSGNDNGVCSPLNENKPRTITVLKTSYNKSEIINYEFTPEDELPQQNVTFGQSRYNPHTQRIRSAKRIQQSKKSVDDLDEKFSRKCKEGDRLKSSLIYIQDQFPNFKYVIIVDPQKNFSTGLLNFFRNTSKIFDLDSSVYCVSAHNPLLTQKIPPEDELHRMDNFIFGGATLIARKLVQEVVQEYRVYPEISEDMDEYSGNEAHPMNDLSDWLSWWSRRRLRGCLISSRPRVCSLAHQCSDVTGNIKLDLQSMINYKYFKTLFQKAANATPLEYESLPCNKNKKPEFRKDVNEKSFGFNVKMISLDDDLTLKLILKCFGLTVSDYMTYEGSSRFYWGDDIVFVVGVPYSRFGPSIVKGSKIYVADMGHGIDVELTTIRRSRDFRDRHFNMTTVPYVFNGGEKNTTDVKQNTTNNN